jgi:hypothetical protein
MEGRGHGIALIEGLRNAAAGFVQAGVIDGDADQPLGAMLERFFSTYTNRF